MSGITDALTGAIGDAGVYAVFALMVFIPSILVTFDARELWNRVSWVDGTAAPPQGVPMAEPTK